MTETKQVWKFSDKIGFKSINLHLIILNLFLSCYYIDSIQDSALLALPVLILFNLCCCCGVSRYDFLFCFLLLFLLCGWPQLSTVSKVYFFFDRGETWGNNISLCSKKARKPVRGAQSNHARRKAKKGTSGK